MVNGFDVKITMSNRISEQTSNLTMAFFRYLIAFLSRHLTDRWHFLLSDLEGTHINNQQSHFGTSAVTLQSETQVLLKPWAFYYHLRAATRPLFLLARRRRVG